MNEGTFRSSLSGQEYKMWNQFPVIAAERGKAGKKQQKIKNKCPVHQHAPIFQFTGLLGFKHHISGRENTPLTAQGLQNLAGIANQTK